MDQLYYYQHDHFSFYKTNYYRIPCKYPGANMYNMMLFLTAVCCWPMKPVDLEENFLLIILMQQK